MARKLIDEGAIGTPIAATVFMGTSGPERWHPSVDFYYQPGGGPLLDIGPYFIGSLILFFGSVSRVTAITRDTSHQRTALDGHQINIQVKTHISGTLEFESGVVATLITSFEMPAHHMPWTELHGTGGSLLFPSPPWGDDLTVQVYEPEQRQWIPKPSVFRLDWRRGIGVADMVHALRSGRPHRTSFEVAYHSLEVMNGILKAGETHQHVAIISRCERPAPLPVGLTGRALD
ncbi:MAG: Gfo/Idh/MocA family oxidoreductase [Anaerolineae bacterium]